MFISTKPFKMKTTILFIYLLSCINAFAQDLPEIPMKNERVYYSFNHKLENSKYCLSKYYNTNFMISLNKKIMNLASIKSGEKPALDIGVYTIKISQGFKNGNTYAQNNLNCKDTAISNINFNSIVFPTGKKENISNRKLTFSVETVFLDKNNYTLIFKGFILQESYLKGRALVTDEIKLEDRYNEISSKAEKTKAEISFIEEMNNILIEIDKFHKEVFEQLYSTDEL